MLFASKEKAERFIVFNKDDIISSGGREPRRVYYCPFCAGWHITSNESEISAADFDKRDEVLLLQIPHLNSIKRPRLKDNKSESPFFKDLQKADSYVSLYDFEAAKTTLSTTITIINEITDSNPYYHEAQQALVLCNALQEMIYLFETVLISDFNQKEYLDSILEKYNPPEEERKRYLRIWNSMLKSRLCISEMENRLHAIKEGIPFGQINDVYYRLDKVKKDIKRACFTKNQKKHFNSIISEIESDINFDSRAAVVIGTRLNIAESSLHNHNIILCANHLYDAQARLNRLPDKDKKKTVLQQKLNLIKEELDSQKNNPTV